MNNPFNPSQSTTNEQELTVPSILNQELNIPPAKEITIPIQQVSTIDESWGEPLPLYQPPEEMTFPIESLPDTIREAVIEAQHETQAPMAMVASCALGAVSISCQGHINVKLDATKVYPVSLFILTIAKSGERKTTCDSLFSTKIKAHEDRLYTQYEKEMKDYRKKYAIWEEKCAGKKQALKAAVKQGNNSHSLESELDNLMDEEPQKPYRKQLLYENLTPEGFGKELQNGYPSVGIFSSEGGAVVGSHGMVNDSAQNFIALLNKQWDADIFISTRATEGSSIRIKNKRTTVVLQLQREAIDSFINKNGSMARGMGLFARCLVCEPESTQGSRKYREPPDKLVAIERFNDRIFDIISKDLPLINSDEKANLELNPCKISLDIEAKKKWINFYNEVETQLGHGGSLETFSDIGSKLPQIALRLAALFHYFETIDNSSAINSSTMLMACEVARYYLSEAKRFYPSIARSEEEVNIFALDNWLLDYCKTNNTNQVSLRYLLQYGPNGIRQKRRRDKALSALAELERIRPKQDGKQKVVEINPSLLK